MRSSVSPFVLVWRPGEHRGWRQLAATYYLWKSYNNNKFEIGSKYIYNLSEKYQSVNKFVWFHLFHVFPHTHSAVSCYLKSVPFGGHIYVLSNLGGGLGGVKKKKNQSDYVGFFSPLKFWDKCQLIPFSFFFRTPRVWALLNCSTYCFAGSVFSVASAMRRLRRKAWISITGRAALCWSAAPTVNRCVTQWYRTDNKLNSTRWLNNNNNKEHFWSAHLLH